MISFNLNNFEGLISLDESTLLNIVIEPVSVFRKFINNLASQIESGDGENKVYIDSNEKVFGKVVSLVANPLFLNADDKKINTFIQKDLVSSISEEQKISFETLISNINEWLDNIILNSNVPLEFNHEVSLGDFLKTFSVSNKNNTDDEVESLVNKLKSISITFGIKVFFIINMHDFYSYDEISTIFHELLIHDIHIISVSNREPKKYADFERSIVIDSDLAELHKFFK